jgi:hypothetical protein
MNVEGFIQVAKVKTPTTYRLKLAEIGQKAHKKD